MRRLIAPVLLLCVSIALTRLTVRFIPYLIGIDTLAEQLNGTLPAGVMYVVLLESLSVIFCTMTIFCIIWLLVRITKISKQKGSHEKQ